MITTGQVRDWLMTLSTGVTDWASGAIDMNKSNAACVYGTRPSPLQPMAVGAPSGYGIRGFTVLVRWGRGATPCEETAFAIWNAVNRSQTNVVIGNRECWVISRQLPIMLGKDAAGIFEATLDFDVWVKLDKLAASEPPEPPENGDGDHTGEED